MLQKWKSWRAKRKSARIAKRKTAIKASLEADLKCIQENENKGLRWRRLREMPGINSMHMNEGRITFIDITMNDGFEITASDFFSEDAILSAAEQVAARIMEKCRIEEGE